MTSFINPYTRAPVRFVVGVSSVIPLFSLQPSSLEGRFLEGLSKLFAQNVCVYVYPITPVALEESLPSSLTAGWKWKSKEGLITQINYKRPHPSATSLTICSRANSWCLSSHTLALRFKPFTSAFLKYGNHFIRKEMIAFWFNQKKPELPASFDSSTRRTISLA